MISMIHGDQVMMLMATEFEGRYHVISVNADYDCITGTWPKCGNIESVSHPWVISFLPLRCSSDLFQRSTFHSVCSLRHIEMRMC
jgi:hypothetical protein